MRRLIIVLLSLLAVSVSLSAQDQNEVEEALTATSIDQAGRDTTLYSNMYLDTVKISRKLILNDYTLFGVQGGVSFNRMSFNPTQKQETVMNMPYVSVSFTRYYKMFGLYPYFGFSIGLSYGQEGYKFKEDKETGKVFTVDGASSVRYDVVELPFLMAGHVDTHNLKFMANIGIYAGYRLGIERFGTSVTDDLRYSFADHDLRWDYGLQGGGGIGIVLDPIEIHFNGIVRYSWGEIYEPDYASKYYYRYAYPFDIMVTAGIYFQLTKRTGRTTRSLKLEAREIVNSERAAK
ncbi:MAG: PorT family protein [Bacteroidales bacterium]|nr:PorT family protein [Bacteroidales bacterium]